MTPGQEEQIAEVIRHWHRLSDLSEFAAKRHGFGDSNGGLGVIYPGDLDEHDRTVEGAHIPAGHVELYGCWGVSKGGYEFVVEESSYLTVVERVLRAERLTAEADAVQDLIGSQND
jgi:hypothetical protein